MTASYFLLFITFLSVICHHVAAAPAYLGCYTDKFAAGERDLSSSLFLEEKMTPELCETKCGGVGYKYAGVQFGSECWCGNTYGKYGKVDDSSCSTKCGGDLTRTCGGELLNAVYEVKGIFPPLKNNVEGRPLLALVMIVKDEAHTLPQTLFSLKDYLDYYYILDTGSTDGTPDAIRRTLGDKGEIHNEPFVDYGTSRNRVLDIARDSKNPPIFVLMLSADETVYNAGALRQFCEQHRNSDGAQHEAYPLVMDVGWKFDSVRLSRVDKGWRYVGRVHEYLAAPDQKWHPSLRVPDTYIKFRVTDPERRSNREYTILKILLDEKEKKPQDTRTSFYLARTYNVIGNHSEALAEFERRVSLGGWQEEVYESLYAIAWQKESLGRSWAEIQQAFLDAHDHSPERAEPLYSIASHYYKENKQSLAYMYALYASQLKYPKNAVLWVQAAVYEWQCHFIVGMTAYRLGKYDIGTRSIMIATRYNPKDSVILQQMARYKEKIDAETWKKYERQYLLGMNDENASDDNPFSVVVPAKDAQPASPGHEIPIKPVPHAFDANSPATAAAFKRSDSASIVFPMLLVIVAFILVMTALKQRKRVRSGDSFSDKVV